VSASYQETPERAFGWVALGDDAQRTGLQLSLPGVKWTAALDDEAHRLGLTVLDGAVRFDGNSYEAELITRRLVEEQTDLEGSIEVGFVDRYRPGTRPLTIGDSGPDVAFLQDFLQDEHYDSVFHESTAERVRMFQRVRDLEATGVADATFWLAMFPDRPRQVDPGDGGMWVRMVQALLAALDYAPDVPTSVYGTRTTRSVRELQRLHGLRVTGAIRGPEWGVLVHRPVDGFPLEQTPAPEPERQHVVPPQRPPAAPTAVVQAPAAAPAARAGARRVISA
jgi:peptidoglycan hydrolase-like protein with peptidoglycan-binding domain